MLDTQKSEDVALPPVSTIPETEEEAGLNAAVIKHCGRRYNGARGQGLPLSGVSQMPDTRACPRNVVAPLVCQVCMLGKRVSLFQSWAAACVRSPVKQVVRQVDEGVVGTYKISCLKEQHLHLLASSQCRCGPKDANIHVPCEKPWGRGRKRKQMAEPVSGADLQPGLHVAGGDERCTGREASASTALCRT